MIQKQVLFELQDLGIVVASDLHGGFPIFLFRRRDLLTLFQKRIQGALFGGSSPSRDIPWMLRMYQAGQLFLDELITTTYKLDDINQGYEDMHAGKNIRGVIIF